MAGRVLLAGGGTGGHLFPALAVAKILKSKGAEVRFVGTRAGVEARVIPGKGYLMDYLWLSGFQRRRILSNLLLPLKVMTSLLQSFLILAKFRPHVALGTGGYVCGPILLAAALCRIPLLLQEQNSYPGITTRWLARFAREVFLNFEEAAGYLPARAKWRHVGNPVRADFSHIDRQAALEKWGLNRSLPTLLVFGGSQGALHINHTVRTVSPRLGGICNLIWSRGHLDKSEPAGWTGPGVLVVESFIDDMPSAYAAADLAVCRSGALTLSELQAAALPAILIPYPYAAGDHQRHNAETFSRGGVAKMIEDRELDGERLLSEVKALFEKADELDKMRRALADRPQANAAEIIVQELLRFVPPTSEDVSAEEAR